MSSKGLPSEEVDMVPLLASGSEFFEGHPSHSQLERWHVGELAGPLGAHVSGCRRCQSFLDGLNAERERLLAREAPEDVVRRLRQVVEQEGKRRLEGTRRASFGRALLPLALLSGVLVTFGQIERHAARDARRSPTAAALASSDPALVAKGGPSLVLIRDRGGEQVTSSDRLAIAPGDRLRLQFQLGAAVRVSAGILTDNGGWVPFLDGELPAGTHMPEATLRVDETPASGDLLFGPSAAVEHARAGSGRAGVQVIHLEWAGPR